MATTRTASGLISAPAVRVPQSVIASANARVHVALLQMSSGHATTNMGLGFSLAGVGWRLELSVDNDFARDQFVGSWESEAESAARALLERLRQVVDLPVLRIAETNRILLHTGLGAKTSLLCAVLRGALEFADDAPDWVTLRNLTERGGTSGIGINLAVDGGLILDAGHKASHGSSFAPSSVRTTNCLPVVAARWKPTHWPVLIVRFPGIRGPFGGEEQELFSRNTPISASEANDVAGHVLYRLLPAIARDDYEGFADTVQQLQHTGFKRAEWSQQPSAVNGTCEFLTSNGAQCVALSSVGPTLAVLGSRLIELHDLLSGLEGVEAAMSYISSSGSSLERLAGS